jgi:hypothetical protein
MQKGQGKSCVRGERMRRIEIDDRQFTQNGDRQGVSVLVEASWCNGECRRRRGRLKSCWYKGVTVPLGLLARPGAEATNVEDNQGSRAGTRADLIPGRGIDKVVGRIVRWQQQWYAGRCFGLWPRPGRGVESGTRGCAELGAAAQQVCDRAVRCAQVAWLLGCAELGGFASEKPSVVVVVVVVVVSLLAVE